MGNSIKPKRSYTANSVPLTTDLEVNELAINWADGKAFTKNASGQIVSVTLGGSGGSSSSEDTALRAFFLPTAPTNVVATAGNAQASVTWTASATIVQIPVTDYVVQFSSNGGTSWTTFSDGTSTSTSAVVTGLQNSTSYVFRVAGVNGVGTGAYSAASSAVTPGVPNDPFFSSVSLLLHMDGSGSTFVDSSGTPKTITANGNATQSTAQSKFGGKSAQFSGSGDTVSFADISLGNGDFVVECWFKTASTVQYAQIFGNESAGGAAGFTCLINNNSASGGQIAVYRQGSLVLSSSTGDWSDDAWHHIAMVRSGQALRLYLDGTQYNSFTDGNSYSGGDWYLGNNNVFSGRQFVGNIDDFRITKGSDRSYTGATIPVPTAPFPDA